MKKKVSVGVIAHNEEGNIAHLLDCLLKQNEYIFEIGEIIVVSSGSIDDTDKIVHKYAKKFNKIVLITEEKRKGKYSAINEFLNVCNEDYLVLISADVIPQKNFLEEICKPLLLNNVGVVASRPKNLKNNSRILDFTNNLQWELAHRISLKDPKYGEAISFKKIFTSLESTTVDEEYIAMFVKSNGYIGAYAHRAVVYNKGPNNLKEYLNQRRRIYCGHLWLKRNGYKPSSMKSELILKCLFRIFRVSKVHLLVISLLLESLGRVLGTLDFYSKKNHLMWDMAKSTKRVYDGFSSKDKNSTENF